MPKVDVSLNPEYGFLYGFIESLPQKFGTSAGMTLFKGRNEIRRFTECDVDMAVKRFKRNVMLKQAISPFAKDKAWKSFCNARELIRRGIDTPVPIAYIRIHTGIFTKEVYYVCTYTPCRPIVERLVERNPYDSRMATDFAGFVAELHQKGILHKDLNNTNVLYKTAGEGYRFQLIDINRMRFYRYGHLIPEKKCFSNLSLFSELTDMFRHVLKQYIRKRGWPEETFSTGIAVKTAHDTHYRNKKRWGKILKGLFGRRPR